MVGPLLLAPASALLAALKPGWAITLPAPALLAPPLALFAVVEPP